MRGAWIGLWVVCALAWPVLGDEAGGVSGSRAERTDRATAAEQFEQMLSRLDRNDPDALASAAAYARETGLPQRAEELARAAVKLSPDHAAARRQLRQVRVEDKWLDLAAVLKLARSRADAGEGEKVLNEMLPALRLLPAGEDQQVAILDLEAHCRLRAGQFERAGRCFAALVDKTDGRAAAAADASRYAAIARILKAHPDGMIVLSQPYPPTSALLATRPQLEAGPVSLSRPQALEAALHEEAKARVKAGRGLMDKGKKLEGTEPEAAKARYVEAGKYLDAADALVPELSRSLRVEIARRQIALINRDMNAEAGKFDALKDRLGQRDLAPGAYNGHLQRMLRSLNNVRGDLEAMLQLAGAYERELVLEIADANQRLQRVNTLRDILNQELHGK